MSLINSQELSIAITILVKTPGMSPIESQLARSVGKHEALAFYVQSVGQMYQMVEEIKNNFTQISAYWSLYEKEALGSVFWAKWPQLWQGEGDLFDQLLRVYRDLKKRHDIVVVMSMDFPLVTKNQVENILNKILQGECDTILSPTESGNYYLFASNAEILSGEADEFNCRRTNILNPIVTDELRAEVADKFQTGVTTILQKLNTVWPGKIEVVDMGLV